MIGEVRAETRTSLFSFAEGIQDLLAGRDTLLAEAVAMDVAEMFLNYRHAMFSGARKK